MDKRELPLRRGSRWVCPNDRHLAMRGKSQKGWSVKTGTFKASGFEEKLENLYTGVHYGESFSLSEDERQTIIQVIQRYEALDLSEQKRIGRLVERMENLKLNVNKAAMAKEKDKRRRCGSRCSGKDGCTCSCALCAEKFGVLLGPSANRCKNCRKYMCQKCSVEVIELRKSSEGNDEMNSSSRSSLRIVSLAQEYLAQLFHVYVQKQFLCRLCVEKKEVWKKSNAWFFKTMPQYILPEKKERERPSPGLRTWTTERTSLNSTGASSQSCQSSPESSIRTQPRPADVTCSCALGFQSVEASGQCGHMFCVSFPPSPAPNRFYEATLRAS